MSCVHFHFVLCVGCELPVNCTNIATSSGTILFLYILSVQMYAEFQKLFPSYENHKMQSYGTLHHVFLTVLFMYMCTYVQNVHMYILYS